MTFNFYHDLLPHENGTFNMRTEKICRGSIRLAKKIIQTNYVKWRAHGIIPNLNEQSQAEQKLFTVHKKKIIN